MYIRSVEVEEFKLSFSHLLEQHFQEANSFEEVEMEVDYDLLESLEQAGLLSVFLVYSNANLCGYFLAIDSPLLTSAKTMARSIQSIFVKEEYRGFRNIRILMNEIEKKTIRDGIQILNLTKKASKHKEGSRKMKRREITYSKYLGE
jgi:hypothetical protein